MKATGIVRGIDNLGRVTIPKSIRNANGWTEGTPMEFLVADGQVILQKYQPATADSIESVKRTLKSLIQFDDPEANGHLNRAVNEIDTALQYLCHESGGGTRAKHVR